MQIEQYRRHGTFNDRQSVNHAALGIDVLKKNSVLDCLADDKRRVILDAVRFHNVPRLPTGRPQTATLFMGLICDADKLDIWKVFADYYHSDQPPEPAIVQHLTDHPVWEKTIIDNAGMHNFLVARPSFFGLFAGPSSLALRSG